MNKSRKNFKNLPSFQKSPKIADGLSKFPLPGHLGGLLPTLKRWGEWLSHPRETFLIFLFCVVGFVALLCYPMSFDELVSLGYLSNLTRGLNCHSQFWCVYPIPGLEINRLLFGLYMQSDYILISLRIFSYAISNLCMMATLLLLVNNSVPGAFFLGGFLSTVSLFIMPKGAYLLPFIFLAMLWIAFQRKRIPGVLLVVIGLLFGILIIQSLCMLAGTSIQEDFTYSVLMMARFQTKVLQANDPRAWMSFYTGALAPYISRNVVYCGILFASLITLLIRIDKCPARNLYAIGCIAIGSAVYLTRVNEVYGQYLNPFLLPLIVLPAFAISILPNLQIKRIVSAAIAIICLISIVLRMPHLLEFNNSEMLIDQLQKIANIQHSLRDGDTVLTAPTFPPSCKPFAFVTFDEIPPLFEECIDDPKVKYEFSADALTLALNSQTPALIGDDLSHFPPPWRPVISEYVRQNEKQYEKVIDGNTTYYLLRRR